jgi:uncharacterized protein
MSSLEQKINDDLKAAMLQKNADLVSVLRMMISALRNKEIALRSGEGKVELTDEQTIEVVSSEVKKRNDSIEAYMSGGRQDLADKEKSEIEILKKYLPAELSDEELVSVIAEIKSSLGDAPNFGQLMGQVMARVKGRVDGNRVSAAVKRILG